MLKINQYFESSGSVIYFEKFCKNSKENADAGVTFLRKRLQNSCFFLDFNPHMNEIFFATLLHEMGPWGHTKGNNQVTR